MNNVSLALEAVNADSILDTATEDAAYDAWLDAHADEMAAEAEDAALVETFLRF